jgi:hypothetical protein
LVAPILVGDFNCVLTQLDTEDRAFCKGRKFCEALQNIVSVFFYVDTFRVLHPCARQFSWHRRGDASIRLDCAYLLPLLVCYVATTSDHHAFLLHLEMAGLIAGPGVTAATSPSFYWKLKLAVLSHPDFFPEFHVA